MQTHFTADTHFGHENIIKYCKRPFKSTKIMNDTLIRNWNQRVKKNDLVIFLGDFCHTKDAPETYLQYLNGHITFIKGNHDHNNSLNTPIEYLVVKQANLYAFCVHDPRDFNNSFYLNLTAHVHEKWKVRKIYNCYLVNVGVDVWNYSPTNINEILAVIEEYKKCQ